MSRTVRSWTDGDELRKRQYRDGRNLRARLELHRRFATNPQSFHRWLFERLPDLAGLRIVDVGCGTAAFWSANRDRIPASAAVVLSDFSIGMARESRGEVGAVLPATRFASADAMALPSRTGAFDAVVANHMLYHVPDRARCFAEIRRVLAPGGWLAAATNGAAHLDELEQLLSHRGVPGAGAVNAVLEAFSLENGAEQLAAQFGDVRTFRYDDALAVTEVEPLLDYVRSMARLAPEDAESIRREVADAIATRGAFGIRKDAGLFLARSP
jgi:ubiquinone/menaquinone biosynthesis C-methylase UbiE